MTAGQVLIIGRSGQVATALARAAWPSGLLAEARGRDELNLSDATALHAAVRERGWTAVINAAAYTAVDRAESEPEAAFALNTHGPRALAEACAHAHIPLIHISTDYVFDGEKREAYEEEDPVNPLSVYGMSKEAGERAIRECHEAHVILRTSWVFSATGGNFVKTMLRLAPEREALSIVADQKGRPTAARDIASMILAIVASIHSGKTDGFGTFHFAGAGKASWYDFAAEIFRQAEAKGGIRVPRLTPIATSDYPTPARRPYNSVLATKKIENVYGVAPRSWTEGLAETLAELMESKA